MIRSRPTLTDAKQNEPFRNYSQTYIRVMEAVSHCRNLVHGRLHYRGQHCAIGEYFETSSMPIDTKAFEEIAAYNDSFPHLSGFQRWQKVNAWLKGCVKTWHTPR